MANKTAALIHFNDATHGEFQTLDDFERYKEAKQRESEETIRVLTKDYNEKLAAGLLAKDIAHASALEKQNDVHTLTLTCIQDELDTERTEHKATKLEHVKTIGEMESKHATAEEGLSKTVDELQAQLDDRDEVVMIKQFDIDELKRELSTHREIDSAKALADHIEEMHGFIEKLRIKMASVGVIEHRMNLLIKDLYDSLVLKTSDNYTCVFLSEEACRMGYKFTTPELGLIGVPIAKRVSAAGTDPMTKHRRFVDGRVTFVNSYTPNSREIIRDELEQAWRVKRARHGGGL